MTALDDARKEEEIAASFGREMAIIEAAALALLNAYYPMSRRTAELIAGIILPAVTPLIRAAALEEAAQRIEADEEDYLVRNEVAAALRALKEQP